MNESVIRLLAEVLTGIQAPGSIGALGAAREPWNRVRDLIGLHGWHTAEEAEEALKKVLTERT